VDCIGKSLFHLCEAFFYFYLVEEDGKALGHRH
jgi:hypothetical protein